MSCWLFAKIWLFKIFSEIFLVFNLLSNPCLKIKSWKFSNPFMRCDLQEMNELRSMVQFTWLPHQCFFRYCLSQAQRKFPSPRRFFNKSQIQIWCHLTEMNINREMESFIWFDSSWFWRDSKYKMLSPFPHYLYDFWTMKNTFNFLSG